MVDSNRNLYLFVTASRSNVDRIGHALRLADRSARPIAKLLAARRGETDEDPAVALTWAYGLIGALQFVTHWWLRDDVVGPDELVEHMTELLWSGVGGGRAR